MTLRKKLHKIYESIDQIPKNGHNKFQNYDYIRAADVTNAIRKALIAQRVYAEINFVFDGPNYTIVREKSINAPFSAVNVRCTIVFHDLDSLETLTSSGLGTGADTGDKAAYKAMTGALKYALKNPFLVPDEADPEADEADPEADESVDRGSSFQETPEFQEARRPATPPAARAAKASAAPKQQQGDLNPAGPKAASVSQPATSAPSAAATSAPAPATHSAGPTVVEREPGDEPATDSLPDEAALNVYRAKFTKLADDLSTTGKLKSSKGLPINRKIHTFMLQAAGAENAATMTVAQWDRFFAKADATQAQGEGGLVRLANLVNEANGIEVKQK